MSAPEAEQAEFFRRTFTIGSRRVGSGERVFVIAEAGVNHFGSIEKALRLVDLAADAGADAFKTQAFSTDELVSSRLKEWRDRLRPKEVDYDFIARMKQRCADRGITFLCTAHDMAALAWLDELEVPAYKIGSGERSNLPFIAAIARRGRPVIVSTGMYAPEHVGAVLRTLRENRCSEVGLLHCVTSYPTPYGQVNLRAMDWLREIFCGPVGYSDHTVGQHVPLAAVALGASIIEKHITLDFDVPNAQDWKVSCGPDDFEEFVRKVRDVELALGQGGKQIQDCETQALGWALKSLVAAVPLSAGTRLEPKMLVAKRPGGGIPPDEVEKLVGRVLRRAIDADAPVSWDDLE